MKKTAVFLASMLVSAAANAQTTQTFTITGTIALTTVCTITSVSLPTSFTGPAVNHGMTVGPVTFTSDMPCAVPPTATLTGSQFVLAGSTLPTTLVIGASDLPAGNYTVSGNAVTAASGGATFRLVPQHK